MYLKEYFNNSNLWGEIKSNGDFTFIDSTIFKNKSIIEYGERTFSPHLIEVNEVVLAEIIVNSFTDKWSKLFNVDLDSLDLLNSENDSTNKSIDINNSNTQNNEVLNKVAGYNDANLMVKDGANNTSNDSFNSSHSETISKNSKSINNLIDNLNKYHDVNIIDVIIKDVINYISLSIFNRG